MCSVMYLYLYDDLPSLWHKKRFINHPAGSLLVSVICLVLMLCDNGYNMNSKVLTFKGAWTFKFILSKMLYLQSWRTIAVNSTFSSCSVNWGFESAVLYQRIKIEPGYIDCSRSPVHLSSSWILFITWWELRVSNPCSEILELCKHYTCITL